MKRYQLPQQDVTMTSETVYDRSLSYIWHTYSAYGYIIGASRSNTERFFAAPIDNAGRVGVGVGAGECSPCWVVPAGSELERRLAYKIGLGDLLGAPSEVFFTPAGSVALRIRAQSVNSLCGSVRQAVVTV